MASSFTFRSPRTLNNFRGLDSIYVGTIAGSLDSLCLNRFRYWLKLLEVLKLFSAQLHFMFYMKLLLGKIPQLLKYKWHFAWAFKAALVLLESACCSNIHYWLYTTSVQKRFPWSLNAWKIVWKIQNFVLQMPKMLKIFAKLFIPPELDDMLKAIIFVSWACLIWYEFKASKICFIIYFLAFVLLWGLCTVIITMAISLISRSSSYNEKMNSKWTKILRCHRLVTAQLFSLTLSCPDLAALFVTLKIERVNFQLWLLVTVWRLTSLHNA